MGRALARAIIEQHHCRLLAPITMEPHQRPPRKTASESHRYRNRRGHRVCTMAAPASSSRKHGVAGGAGCRRQPGATTVVRAGLPQSHGRERAYARHQARVGHLPKPAFGSCQCRDYGQWLMLRYEAGCHFVHCGSNWLANKLTRCLAAKVLDYLTVAPPYQRLGIASMLLASGLKVADANGLKTTLMSSPAALKVYQRQGFELLRTVSTAYPQYGGTLPVVTYFLVRQPVPRGLAKPR